MIKIIFKAFSQCCPLQDQEHTIESRIYHSDSDIFSDNTFRNGKGVVSFVHVHTSIIHKRKRYGKHMLINYLKQKAFFPISENAQYHWNYRLLKKTRIILEALDTARTLLTAYL